MVLDRLIIRRFSSYYMITIEAFEEYLDEVEKNGDARNNMDRFGALLDRDWVCDRGIEEDFSVSFINSNRIMSISRKLEEIKNANN